MCSFYSGLGQQAKNRMNFLKAEYCTIVDAVCVKLISGPVQQEIYWRMQGTDNLESEDLKGYVTTFRVKRSTKFEDIYEAS
jgi:hypothetical protein